MCWVARMDSNQALAILERSPALISSKRLRSARFLAGNATIADRSRIFKIREAEHNSWVQKALDQAIKRIEERTSKVAVVEAEETTETLLDGRFYEEVYAQAIEEVSEMFLHELRTFVGFLEIDADSEIDCYNCSNTKSSVVRIQSFLAAIDMLRCASAAPVIQELDLTDLVVRILEVECRHSLDSLGGLTKETGNLQGSEGYAEQFSKSTGIGLTLARQDPVSTSGAGKLVEVALANAIRNAIEAVLAVEERSYRGIILNWGITNTDSWIVLLDEGCGLPAGIDRLMEPGVSTKPKDRCNLGMGLPIAQRAIQSIQGTLQLTPRSKVGVSCEIRWPHKST